MANKSDILLGAVILAGVCIAAYILFVPQLPSYSEVKAVLGPNSEVEPIYSDPLVVVFGHPLFQRLEGWEFDVWVVEGNGSRGLGGDIYSKEDLSLQGMAAGGFESGS